MNFSGYIHRSSGFLNNRFPVEYSNGNQLTLPSGTGTVAVSIHPDDSCFIQKTQSGVGTFGFYLSDVNNNRVKICSITVNGNSKIKSGDFPSGDSQKKNLSSLAGKALYAWFQLESGNSNGLGFSGSKMPITIKSNTAVVAGNKIVTNDINQTGTSITAGTIMTNSKFSKGTKCEASTFNSQVLDV